MSNLKLTKGLRDIRQRNPELFVSEATRLAEQQDQVRTYGAYCYERALHHFARHLTPRFENICAQAFALSYILPEIKNHD